MREAKKTEENNSEEKNSEAWSQEPEGGFAFGSVNINQFGHRQIWTDTDEGWGTREKIELGTIIGKRSQERLNIEHRTSNIER